MNQIKSRENKTNELLALGDLLPGYDGPRRALAIAARGGDAGDLMRETAQVSRNEPVTAAADRMLGLDCSDTDGYSISAAINAQIKHDWKDAGLERSISDLVSAKTGRAPHGVFVPFGLMTRDFNAGVASAAGNLIGGRLDVSHDMDPLRNVSALARMGAFFMTGLNYTLSLPRMTTYSASAVWQTETAAATVIDEATALLTLTPSRQSVQMTISKQALKQATPALDVLIGKHFIKAIMERVDDGGLNGTGTSNAPVGVRSTAGITTVVGGTNGAQISWAHLAALEYGPAAGNAPETDFSGFIVNPASRKWMRTTPRGTNLPFMWEGGERPLLGYRAAVTNTMPANLTKGTSSTICSSLTYANDWSQLVIGIYGAGIDVLADEFTKADTGDVRLIVSAIVGLGVNMPASFAKMDDALTA